MLLTKNIHIYQITYIESAVDRLINGKVLLNLWIGFRKQQDRQLLLHIRRK